MTTNQTFTMMIAGAALLLVFPAAASADDAAIAKLPDGARLVIDEDWSTGKIDPARWYVLRKRWGRGNHGVVPENVRIERDTVRGVGKHVLVCEAHGDHYDGDVVGLWGNKKRVGGVIVSKAWLASGRFEVVMKVGSDERNADGPRDPMRPIGTVPAIWTFGYRYVEVPKERMREFVRDTPLYNPHMPRYGIGANEYWSELDFPEFGKGGVFNRAMYNTFCQNRHHPELFDVKRAVDGRYHTYTTEWRTELVAIDGVTDAQVVEHGGYHWVADKAVPFEAYLGNPLKRLGPNRFAVYRGKIATHWIDGVKVAENTKWVPAMAAQLNMGVWLPDWAGPAPWKTASVKFASVKAWQYDDPGDVRGVIHEDLRDNFDAEGKPIKGEPL